MEVLSDWRNESVKTDLHELRQDFSPLGKSAICARFQYIKNQAAISPTGLVEHASESVPGSTHDLTLLRQTDLVSELADDEAAMLDKGYDGIATDYPDKKLYLPFKARRNHPLTEEQKAYNQFLAKYRIVVEHSLAQLNKFQILAQRFRHQLTKHSVIFRIVPLASLKFSM